MSAFKGNLFMNFFQEFITEITNGFQNVSEPVFKSFLLLSFFGFLMFDLSSLVVSLIQRFVFKKRRDVNLYDLRHFIKELEDNGYFDEN